jgi:CheY-like chemotaxis protein
MKVLAIDDVMTDRFIIKKLLQTDFEVTTLSSAKEALAFAQAHTFDIALINAMLQEDMDCIPLLRSLRHINRFGFQAIATTCYIDPLRQQKILSAGFEEILLKPFDKELFMQMVFQKRSVGASAGFKLNSTIAV